MLDNALLVGQLSAIYMIIIVPGLCVSIVFAKWEANQWKKGKGIF